MQKLLNRYDTLAGKFFMVADILNILFFLISLGIWLYGSIRYVGPEFQPGDLWKAFNGLYSHFEFKVSCILFICYNGLLGAKSAFDQAFFTFVSFHRWRTVGSIAKKAIHTKK